jgi:hypothetical protein
VTLCKPGKFIFIFSSPIISTNYNKNDNRRFYPAIIPALSSEFWRPLALGLPPGRLRRGSGRVPGWFRPMVFLRGKA